MGETEKGPRVPDVVTDGGPWATHDQACAVCRVRHAVLDVGSGVFGPCWSCQEDGWRIERRFRVRGGLYRLLYRKAVSD